MLGQREYVALGISMILCGTTDLVLTSVCLPFGASGFKFGSWVDVVGVPIGISTWRKIIDLWRKRCATLLAQVLVNGVESRRGSGQGRFARLIWH